MDSFIEKFGGSISSTLECSTALIQSALPRLFFTTSRFLSAVELFRLLLRHMHVVCAHLLDGGRQAVIVQSHAGPAHEAP